MFHSQLPQSRSTSFMNKKILFKVKTDQFIPRSRSKAVSVRISTKQQKLQDDYKIFQYLKTDRNKLSSLHITSLHSERKQDEIITPPPPPPPVKPVEQPKKDYMQHKILQHQKELKAEQEKRRIIMVIKQKQKLQKDMQDIQQITNKALKQFENKLGLYNKYYSQELVQSETYRYEDMNLPKNTVHNVENTNTFRTILSHKALEPQQFKDVSEFNGYKFDVNKIRRLSQQVSEHNGMLNKGIESTTDEFMEYIKKNDMINIRIILQQQPTLVNCRNKFMETPLHIAAKKGLIELVEYLLCNGGDEGLRDLWNRSARQVAAQYGNQDVMKLLSYQ